MRLRRSASGGSDVGSTDVSYVGTSESFVSSFCRIKGRGILDLWMCDRTENKLSDALTTSDFKRFR